MRYAAAMAMGFLTAVGPLCAGENMSVITKPTVVPGSVMILDATEPPPDASSITRDILSEQTLLGSGVVAVPEGRITVGKLERYALRAPQLDGARRVPLPGEEQSSFYLLVFRFTLHDAPPKRRYREMTFKVLLSDPRTTAYKLYPERVVSEEDVEKGLEKGFDIGFVFAVPGDKAQPALEAKASVEATQTVKFTRLIPEITAFGDGEKDFYWKFRGHGDMPLESGTRRAAAVIQVPKGTQRLNASIAWDIDLERSRFDQWSNVPVKVEGVELDLPLL